MMSELQGLYDAQKYRVAKKHPEIKNDDGGHSSEGVLGFGRSVVVFLGFLHCFRFERSKFINKNKRVSHQFGFRNSL